jgi:hypothetical protein
LNPGGPGLTQAWSLRLPPAATRRPRRRQSEALAEAARLGRSTGSYHRVSVRVLPPGPGRLGQAGSRRVTGTVTVTVQRARAGRSDIASDRDGQTGNHVTGTVCDRDR